MTRVYLSRHGQTEWNVQKRMQGHNNSNLTELGIEQALALAERMRDVQIDIAYSSSSQRAVNTTKIVLEIGRAHV